MTALTAYAPLDPLKDARHRDARAARDQADWLKHLELALMAARTLDSYERYTAALLRAFPDKRFDEFTDGDLAHVLAQYPPKSRHIVKASWNNWFSWGYERRRIPGNPVGLLPRIRYRPNRVYDTFTLVEVEALCGLSSPDGPLMEVLFWAGLRRAEARMLTGKRINFAKGHILVKEGAKGSKQRVVPMADRLATALAELFTLEGIGPDDFLWYRKPGAGRVDRSRAMANSTFDTWWARCLSAADVRHRNPHMARHTFASHLFRMGLKSKQIAAVLGHKSTATTDETYIHVSDADLAAAVRDAIGSL